VDREGKSGVIFLGDAGEDPAKVVRTGDEIETREGRSINCGALAEFGALAQLDFGAFEVFAGFRPEGGPAQAELGEVGCLRRMKGILAEQ
jgi:hypothetical protein